MSFDWYVWSPLNTLHLSLSDNLHLLVTQVDGETADYDVLFKVFNLLVQSFICDMTDRIGWINAVSAPDGPVCGTGPYMSVQKEEQTQPPA